MGLDKYQKSQIKPVVIWIGLYIVIMPLSTSIAGEHWTWSRFFMFAALSVLILGLSGVPVYLFFEGSKK